jgi:hypothetical protein
MLAVEVVPALETLQCVEAVQEVRAGGPAWTGASGGGSGEGIALGEESGEQG